MGNPAGSRYRSLPEVERPRPKANWTVHKDTQAAVKRKAAEEGITEAALVERVMSDYCGIPRPPRPPNDRGAKKST